MFCPRALLRAGAIPPQAAFIRFRYHRARPDAPTAHLGTAFHHWIVAHKQRSLIYYIPTEDILRSSFSLASLAEESHRSYAGDGVFRTSIG